ncbi:MAG: hypothetical protein ACR2JC_09810 [Chloroflexota bacterium]
MRSSKAAMIPAGTEERGAGRCCDAPQPGQKADPAGIGRPHDEQNIYIQFGIMVRGKRQCRRQSFGWETSTSGTQK